MSEPREIKMFRVENGGYIITADHIDRGLMPASYAFSTLPEALAYVSEKIWPTPTVEAMVAKTKFSASGPGTNFNALVGKSLDISNIPQ